MGRRAKAQQNASLDSAPQLDRVNTTHIGSNDPPVSASAMAVSLILLVRCSPPFTLPHISEILLIVMVIVKSKIGRR